MSEVSIRDLCNHVGDIVDRAQSGERLTITRAGKPVAALVGLRPAPLALDEVLRRREHLPHVDPDRLRSDVDDVIEPAL